MQLAQFSVFFALLAVLAALVTPWYPLRGATRDLLCVLSMDTWWNFSHEFKKNQGCCESICLLGYKRTFFCL